MKINERHYWHDKLNRCWTEFRNERPELSLKYNNFFYGLTLRVFMLYLEKKYGILVTSNVEINEHGSLRLEGLGVEKIEIIDPVKKMLLDIKYE